MHRILASSFSGSTRTLTAYGWELLGLFVFSVCVRACVFVDVFN